MKKIFIVLLLILVISTSAYALNIFDIVLYKKVALVYIHRYVLINRLTGEVEYVMRNDGLWAPIPKELRTQYRSMYNAQIAIRGF
jgi:hypothetical protein